MPLVLVIEDNHEIASLLCEHLEHEGYDVDYAADGVTGLHLAVTGDFDVIILDRAMPGIGGDEVAVEIKKRAPAIPVVMLTGFGDIMKQEGDHPPGVHTVLSKPITLLWLACFSTSVPLPRTPIMGILRFGVRNLP